MTAVRVGSKFPHLLQLSNAGRQRYDLPPLTVIEPGEPLQNGVTASRCLEVAFGIVANTPEKTIRNLARLNQAMRDVEYRIVEIMREKMESRTWQH